MEATLLSFRIPVKHPRNTPCFSAGERGPPGAEGRRGSRGRPGPDGRDGEPGKDGADGYDVSN